jgi:hypothetical protein
MKITVFDPSGLVTRNAPLEASGNLALTKRFGNRRKASVGRRRLRWFDKLQIPKSESLSPEIFQLMRPIPSSSAADH